MAIRHMKNRIIIALLCAFIWMSFSLYHSQIENGLRFYASQACGTTSATPSLRMTPLSRKAVILNEAAAEGLAKRQGSCKFNLRTVLKSAGRTEVLPERAVDIDLSQANSILVFSQQSNMYAEPWNYLGAIVRIRGTLGFIDDVDGGRCSMVMVRDAAACCTQGIEFESNGRGLSEDSASEEDEIIVTGRFELCQEDGYSRIRLVDAVVEKS